MCEWIEEAIRVKGGTPAFPCNICVNEIAAHYSSPIRDASIVPESAIVKVDIGVHVDGYLADTATTVSLTPQCEALVYVINEALEQAIKVIRPGVKTNRIGEVIQKTIENHGFKPIWNLSGHQMYRYVLHSGKSIPNVQNFSIAKLKEGEIFAIEPFLTLASGRGEVQNGSESYIYRFQKERRINNSDAKKLQSRIKKDFKTLPFSKRWLIEQMPEGRFQSAFNELMRVKSITNYPVLVEISGKPVAQAEHTVIVTKDGCLVTTQ
jgi:methionyl aminopeptidase